MEFIDGPNLRQLMHGQKLSPREALSIVPRICEALQFAHDEGVVHRDIKPENILLDKRGRVKIADFGIAKITGKGRDATLTGAKDVIGTPHYMAPEQIEHPTEVDHRADIYSLGVVFYEMLTGELPLGKFEVPSHKVQVDVRLDEVVLHALEKEPARRYQHAKEVKTDVETIAGSPASAQTVPRRADEDPSVASARRQVKGPAIGLLVTGIANWVLIPLALWLFQWGIPRTGACSWMALSQPALVGIGLVSLALCVFIVFAAFRMMQLENRGAAIIASLLAIVVSPGNLVGLPIGLWALVVLNRSEVREAFSARKAPVTSTERTPAAELLPGWVVATRWTARVLGTLLLAFYGFFVLAEGLPPIASQPEGVQLNFVALGLMLGGFVVGWKREGTAALLIASGWTLWHISEGRMDWNVFQTPLPVAALYAVCWWATRGRRTGVVLTALASLAVLLGLGRLLVPTSVFVRGTVLDAQSGLPVPQAELRLLPRPFRSPGEDDAPNARSNPTGNFTLYVGWYAEAKQVALSAAGYHTLTTNLGPRALGARNVKRDFFLQPSRPSPTPGKAPPATVPPVVVSTAPASGSRDVDPALTELCVTFSKPMRDGSWSWARDDETTYPETIGEPRYTTDRRTCILPVKLHPGRVYALWINMDKLQGFQDRDGLPAVPYLLVFETKR
jgi:hypothetical protein